MNRNIHPGLGWNASSHFNKIERLDNKTAFSASIEDMSVTPDLLLTLIGIHEPKCASIHPSKAAQKN